MPSRPEVVDEARERGIADVVHFTTVRGAVGVLASCALKSRERLPKDKYLEHVYSPNCNYRKDEAWLDYVNLSITRINDSMFTHSERWHAQEGVSWVVLAFDSQILSHPGVVFTTTNNIYTGCRRAEGLEGLRALFSERIVRWNGEVLPRSSNHKDNWPTDRQAEVLYPGQVPCKYLRRIDVQEEKQLDTIEGAFGALDSLNVNVSVEYTPEVFV